jgi:hypothetical protein
MQAKDAIKLLQELPADEEIMIQWFTKDMVELNMNTGIKQGLWDRMMVVWEKEPATMEDFQVQEIKNIAEDDMFLEDEDAANV